MRKILKGACRPEKMRARRWIPRKRVGVWVREAELAGMAKKLFGAAGKNPYHLGERAIRNLEELRLSLDEFTEKDAKWIASWIEYLGDPTTASRILRTPSEFKKIIVARYDELKPFFA